MTPFRRDGHLTDLALDQLVEEGSLDGTEAHLEACAVCRDRLAAANAFELPVPVADEKRGLPPQASVAAPPAQPAAANRPWMWAALLVTAAAAAVLLGINVLSSGDPGEPDGIRVKGVAVGLQVFRDEGDTSERLRSGDVIAAGDRLGFRVRNRTEGHLMIIGVDARSEGYLCYPQGLDGASEQVEAAPVATQLPEAIRMDATPGSERLVAIFCKNAFDYDDVIADLIEGSAPADCAIDEVVLEKR